MKRIVIFAAALFLLGVVGCDSQPADQSQPATVLDLSAEPPQSATADAPECAAPTSSPAGGLDDSAIACGRPCHPGSPSACGGHPETCCLTPSCGYICGGTCGGGGTETL